MSALWTFAELFTALGVHCPADSGRTIGGFSIDTRTLKRGDLFIALPGEKVDGHAFVKTALDQGAVGALVSRVPSGVDPQRLIVVQDPLSALTMIAAAARARFSGRVVGLTGSVGKTSSKEMLRVALEACGLRVHATAGNLNNHIGVPLTLAMLPRNVDIAVIEMGMNHAGEISALTHLVRPNVALVTTISPAHLAYFGTLESIADAKAEIFEALEPDGTAVLYRDSPFFARLEQAAKAGGAERIISFGKSHYADIRLMDFAIEPGRTSILANRRGEPLAYDMPVEGVPWVFNSLGVLGVVDALGAPLNTAIDGLSKVNAVAGRGSRTLVNTGDGVFEVIDESYNANPDSMAAALETLSLLKRERSGRKIAVLGDMLELGPEEITLHTKLARSVVEGGIDLVYTVGPRMANLFEVLPTSQRGSTSATAEEMCRTLVAEVRPGDVVMIKGSHGSRVNLLVDALIALDRSQDMPAGESTPVSR